MEDVNVMLKSNGPFLKKSLEKVHSKYKSNNWALKILPF